MRKFAVAAVVGAASILAAGCGGGESDGTDAGAGEVSSPIAEFLGYDTDFSDPEAAQAQFVEQERARQEAIAVCMREEGFEYVPVDPGQFTVFEAADGLEYGSDEWVAKYGFGITTQRWPQSALGPDLIGYEDFGMEEGPQDPNQEIVEAMTESEQEAYFAALYGNQDEFVFDESLSEEEQEETMSTMVFEPSGCEGEAQSADPANERAMRFYTEFSDELEGLYERVQNDPRIVEWETGVKECVAGKGLEYPGSDEIYEFYEEKLQGLDEEIVYPGQDLTEADYEAMSETELEAIFNQPPTISPAALTRIGELQAEEIALAKAVAECDGGFEAQSELVQEVYVEYEQKFLDDNTDRLAEFESGGE